jgi:hypothetical protein
MRIACGSGLHSVRQPGSIRPDGRIGEAVRQHVRVEAWDTLQVRQRRHVHDRHRRLFRFGHRIEQFAHAGGAILRLLHGQRHEVIVAGVDARRAGGRELAGELLRVDLHRGGTATYRHLDADAIGVDGLDLGGEADQRDLVSAEQQFARQQRPVGRTHDQHFLCCH